MCAFSVKMYAIVCDPLDTLTFYTYIIIGLLARVGNLTIYAMSVRRNFDVCYSHLWEPVPPTTRVGLMYAYGGPRHSEV